MWSNIKLKMCHIIYIWSFFPSIWRMETTLVRAYFLERIDCESHKLEQKAFYWKVLGITYRIIGILVQLVLKRKGNRAASGISYEIHPRLLLGSGQEKNIQAFF